MMGADQFVLDMDVTEAEHSKDSHSNTFDISVDGRDVEYHGPWGEGVRGWFDTQRVTFTLTDDQVSRIRRTIDNYDLRQSVSETFETEPTGPSHSVDADATLVVDGERYDLQIAGTTSVKGDDTAMEHIEQARGLLFICRSLWRYGAAANGE